MCCTCVLILFARDHYVYFMHVSVCARMCMYTPCTHEELSFSNSITLCFICNVHVYVDVSIHSIMQQNINKFLSRFSL